MSHHDVTHDIRQAAHQPHSALRALPAARRDSAARSDTPTRRRRGAEPRPGD